MRPNDRERGARLKRRLTEFSRETRKLHGLTDAPRIDTLVEQLVDSLRRIEFIHAIRDGRHSPSRADPSSPLFDPLKAAVLRYREGDVEEAYWLTFIATHFGKHKEDGWQLARAVYGRLGAPGTWDWSSVSRGESEFRSWLAESQGQLRSGPRRRFSNHRKYESLSATSTKGTAAVFESYVRWVATEGSHQELIRAAHRNVGQHPEAAFDHLYRSMSAVLRFGRLAKFDYLTMLGKLGFAPISPGSAYLSEATGPLSGARLLFDNDPSSSSTGKQLDAALVELDDVLQVGKQVLEDALCNWQKSPGRFVHFSG